ncbi:hypothetical protein AAFF_G00121120 [Aldrovandia affinis]|uniref:Uncharacterized protein n=1 Tax=Aldrovandia affinis TaxID=143900 RepID=A0AAD7R1M9_9TELE|nr:hypothetical protein AAFF_G00121120 [Aldrovandia affinis]
MLWMLVELISSYATVYWDVYWDEALFASTPRPSALSCRSNRSLFHTSSSSSFLKHTQAARFLNPSPSYVRVWFGLNFIMNVSTVSPPKRNERRAGGTGESPDRRVVAEMKTRHQRTKTPGEAG